MKIVPTSIHNGDKPRIGISQILATSPKRYLKAFRYVKEFIELKGKKQ